MGLSKDQLTSRVDKNTITQWVKDIASNENIDVVIIGCSAFRACSQGYIDYLESLISKPVITSTQCFLWNMLRLSGIKDNLGGYGTLFRNH